MARERETEAARRRRVAERVTREWGGCVTCFPGGVVLSDVTPSQKCLIDRIVAALAAEARRATRARRAKP